MKKTKFSVAVLGAGNMGTAVAKILGDNKHDVKIWNWEGDQEPLKQIEKFHENKKYLPGIRLPKNVRAEYQLAEAVKGAEIVFFVIPSSVFAGTASKAAEFLADEVILVDMSKGLEPKSMCLIPDLLVKSVRTELKNNIISVSGPAVAGQMAQHKFTVMNVAGINPEAVKKVKTAMDSASLRLVPTDDIVGVELGGSFKNVYAIAMGICDGLGFSLNAKAALLSKAMEEIAVLIEAMGGRRETAYGIAGFGDLIGTALATESRNRTYGEYLGKGYSDEKAMKKMKQTVEGRDAVECLIKLANKYKMKVSLGEVVFKCVKANSDARGIFKEYLEKVY